MHSGMSEDEKVISMVLVAVVALVGIGALVWRVVMGLNSMIQTLTSVIPN